MVILGVNAYHGDSSAALVRDGELVAAVEEERLNRIKHWAGFPAMAIQECLRLGGISARDIDHCAVSRNPSAHLYNKVMYSITRGPSFPLLRDRLRNSLKFTRFENVFAAAVGVPRDQLKFKFHPVEHHRSHLASAFFVSPFEEAAVASIDGFGDFVSVMWGAGRGNRIETSGQTMFPHSLGIFYTAFTQFLGFPSYGDEYKMMGLAAYGQPRFVREVDELMHVDEQGQVVLALDYFVHHNEGVNMTWENGSPTLSNIFAEKFLEKFGPPRVPRSEITSRDADLAASVQAVLEKNYFRFLNFVHKQTDLKKVCLAGGVALNCVANGKIFAKTPFTDYYVQGAAHDAGTSLGAAFWVWNQLLQNPRSLKMEHLYWGPSYTDEEICRELEAGGLRYAAVSREQLIETTAQALADGQIVGWFQGRMEFGPRALGSRSILADPRRADMKDTLNLRIKYREPFRPFCPSILQEAVGEFFETDYPSPFMIVADRIRVEKRSRIPAVTHGDGTGRLQTVTREANPLYWDLIRRFADKTAVPVLLNTSFNENEPIVNNPREAIECFLRTQMDMLAIGSFVLSKKENLHLTADRAAFAQTAGPS